MKHSLNILQEQYESLSIGLKRFEIGLKDRDYRVGDLLILKEYDDGNYTGRELVCLITYILDDAMYCPQGFVILSIRLCQIKS